MIHLHPTGAHCGVRGLATGPALPPDQGGVRLPIPSLEARSWGNHELLWGIFQSPTLGLRKTKIFLIEPLLGGLWDPLYICLSTYNGITS